MHTPQYVHKLKTGTLTALEELELEVPYSPELVRAFWLTAGGSVLAADHALVDGVGSASVEDSITRSLGTAKASA